jgi:CDP-diacylglycerol---serine O-phosphatidyltransferase
LIEEHGTLPGIDHFLLSTPVLIVITILFSYLLVAEIPMFSLKFKNLSWKANRVQFLFLAGSVLLLATLQLYGISAIVLLFIGISGVLSLRKK